MVTQLTDMQNSLILH